MDAAKTGDIQTLAADASAAIGFIHNNTSVGRMKHIDMRASWVNMVRNLKELEYVHVPGTINKADVLSKIIQGKSFEEEQKRIMTPLKDVP